MQKNFLMPEIRCGFQVSKKRKKIWKVQIELIEEIDRVCKKHHLRYYASNGTLLGIIRHKGFVPWDDDVDIIMPRPDYQKLIEVSGQEFKKPFFLQTAMNDDGYYRNYTRLRNSNTTAIPLRDLNRRSNNGIFIDIFPMDGCPPNRLLRKCRFFLITLCSAMANTYTYYPDFDTHKILRKILRFLASVYCKMYGYSQLIQRMEKLRSQTAYDKGKEIYVITHGGKCMIFPKIYFQNIEWLDFEYIKLPVPTEYAQILKSHYGDYMQFPPAQERGQHHSIFFDPDKSYIEYVNVMSREEIKEQLNNY